MRNGYSAAQIRAAEEPHLAAGEPLMQRAAAALADEIRGLLRVRGAAAAGGGNSAPVGASAPTVVLLVGTGNNGGDALFAGALLAADGVRVEIVPVGGRMHEDGLSAATAAGARVHDSADPAGVASLVANADLIVDGILGTGSAADPALRGRAREIVAAILPVVRPLPVRSPARPLVVAVDIPSGIGADDGSVPDPTVLPADTTVTFGGHKAGLLMGQAQRFTGLVKLVDIGLALELGAMRPVVRG
ncbi:MAG: NAD(P)H-hydrate epimerase [Microbacteriaceae bacterium]|nr:NAD(P)H-hydrate epimerase [Microbacteriaceae bacterium]